MYLTVSTAMKFPPFFFLLSMVAISTSVSATSDWEYPIFPQQGFISYLNNPSH